MVGQVGVRCATARGGRADRDHQRAQRCRTTIAALWAIYARACEARAGRHGRHEYEAAVGREPTRTSGVDGGATLGAGRRD